MGRWQIVVSTRQGQGDALGQQTAALLADFAIRSVKTVRSARVFLVELEPGCRSHAERSVAQRIATELLCDPVTEQWAAYGPGEQPLSPAGVLAVEVRYRPGVTDSVANSALLALRDMGISAKSVSTARRFELSPIPSDDERPKIAQLLGNECIEEVVFGFKPIETPPAPPSADLGVRQVAIRSLGDEELQRLSREGHLFLSLDEMRSIQSHFSVAGRDPTDLELETLAQTWSEHCVHKTLTAAIDYVGAPFPIWARTGGTAVPEVVGEAPADNDGTPPGPAAIVRRYDNLLKDTIVQATRELIDERRGPTCLSVFKDNAGVIAFDEQYGIAFKVETHNHPSAIEPYGGAATGIGGVIRDVLGCGLGAKPIANTDVFCVAPPDWPVEAVPRGVIHPKLVLKGVVAGVRDYGNCMGIPTVNGAVHFDPRYLGNPLVYCGCVGLIPRDRLEKAARPGDAVVLIGGRTGRDGIHGATFSSTELTDTHAHEFAHAVQIGNPIEEKKVLDVVLQARDYADAAEERPDAESRKPHVESRHSRCLYSAITDCGAGGLSSAVGEMGESIGAEVDLEKVPLKYAGLRYDEIWISEAQERMVLAVPPGNVEAMLRLAAREDVEATVIGQFTDTGRLVVRYGGSEVGNLDMQFLHHGLPKTTRRAEWPLEQTDAGDAADSVASAPRGRRPCGAGALTGSRPTRASAPPGTVASAPPGTVASAPPGAVASAPRGRRGIREATPLPRRPRGEDARAPGLGQGVDDLVRRPRGGDATAARFWSGTQSRAETTPRPRPGAPRETTLAEVMLEELMRRLSDPTVASKHWIVRQYDHEVQAGSVIKPLAGPHHGPSDAAVLRPRLGSNRGIALGCGLAPQVADLDPYWMAVAAIDEAVRNVVCVGGDPEQTAVLDNFCWPSVDDPRSLGALVRACQACYDMAKAYGVPFISGKDSLNNEFALNEAGAEMLRTLFAKRWPNLDCSLCERAETAASAPRGRRSVGPLRPTGGEGPSPHRKDRLAIPYTLLISALSIVDDVTRCVSMDLKQEQSQLYLLGQPTTFFPNDGSGRPFFDPAVAIQTHRTGARLIREGLVCAVHDVSDGGLFVACAEMSLAGGRACRVHGLRTWLDERDEISRSAARRGGAGNDWRRFYFGASPALYIVEAVNDRHDEFVRVADSVPSLLLATVGEESTARGREFSFETPDVRLPLAHMPLGELETAWKTPLDW